MEKRITTDEDSQSTGGFMTDLTMKQIEAWIEELTQKSQELQRFHNILFSSDMIDTMKVSIYEERIRYLKGQLLKMKG